jgi:hypothetical protein
MFQFHQENPEGVRCLESRDELLSNLGHDLRRELQILDIDQLKSLRNVGQ